MLPYDVFLRQGSNSCAILRTTQRPSQAAWNRTKTLNPNAKGEKFTGPVSATVLPEPRAALAQLDHRSRLEPVLLQISRKGENDVIHGACRNAFGFRSPFWVEVFNPGPGRRGRYKAMEKIVHRAIRKVQVLTPKPLAAHDARLDGLALRPAPGRTVNRPARTGYRVVGQARHPIDAVALGEDK